MPRDTVETLKVTFSQSLPMGTRGTFTHDGELWIAYPSKKNTRILSVIDRLLGVHEGITKEMIRWINARPQDAELVTKVLERVARAKQIHEELVTEKAKAATE